MQIREAKRPEETTEIQRLHWASIGSGPKSHRERRTASPSFARHRSRPGAAQFRDRIFVGIQFCGVTFEFSVGDFTQ